MHRHAAVRAATLARLSRGEGGYGSPDFAADRSTSTWEGGSSDRGRPWPAWLTDSVAQVRAHRRCAVAANAALLAGVTDVERAAAAGYLTGRA